jgi:hypothetical protein
MKLLTVALTAIVMVARPALAHHSFANFDLNRDITLVGTIKEVQFTNPHVWLQVMVPDGKVGNRTPSRVVMA